PSASNLPAFPSILAGCTDPLCGFLNTGMLPPSGSQPLPPFSPAFFASLPGQVQIINNLVGIDPTQLAALKTLRRSSTPVPAASACRLSSSRRSSRGAARAGAGRTEPAARAPPAKQQGSATGEGAGRKDTAAGLGPEKQPDRAHAMITAIARDWIRFTWAGLAPPTSGGRRSSSRCRPSHR